MTDKEETDLLMQAQAGDVAAFERFVLLFDRRVRVKGVKTTFAQAAAL